MTIIVVMIRYLVGDLENWDLSKTFFPFLLT